MAPASDFPDWLSLFIHFPNLGKDAEKYDPKMPSLRQGWLSKPSGKVCGRIQCESINLPPLKPIENRHFGSEQPKGRRKHNTDGAERPSLPSRAGRDGFPSRPGKGSARSSVKASPSRLPSPLQTGIQVVSNQRGSGSTTRTARSEHPCPYPNPSLPFRIPASQFFRFTRNPSASIPSSSKCYPSSP